MIYLPILITISILLDISIDMKFIFKLLLPLLIAVMMLDFLYVTYLWIQRDVSRQGEIPVSRFMQSYIQDRAIKTHLPAISWQPVALEEIPETVVRAFIIAEDTRFYVHKGFDVQAIKNVIRNMLKTRSVSRGASTITQQTAKNLFLYPKRSWLRKWHEFLFAILLESWLEKNRILEIYLNIAEFAQGVYGVDAAAQHYFSRPIVSVLAKQAAYLAATLPWPQKHNYKTGTQKFYSHAQRIYARSRKEYIPK